MPDYRGKECYECQEKFTTLKRRHHCRICGQIFCARCCNQEIPGRLLGYMGNLRLCNYCCEAVEQFLDQEVDSSDSGMKQDMSSPALGQLENAGPLASACGRPVHAAEDTTIPKIAVISSSGTSSIWGGMKQPLQKQTSVGSNADRLRPAALSVTDLVAPEPDLDVVSLGGESSTADDLEPEWVKSIEASGGPFYFDSDVAKTTDVDLDLADGTSAYYVDVPSPNQAVPSSNACIIENDGGQADNKSEQFSRSPPVAMICPMAGIDKTSLSLASEPDLQTLDTRSDTASVCLSGLEHHKVSVETAFEHQALLLLNHLLLRDQLDPLIWKPLMWPLIKKVAFTVQPNIPEKKDDMDILTYVHVKTVVTSDSPSIRLVFGTVCTKSVANLRMKKSINNPEILIIGGSVEYERVSGKFGSLDPIIMQESEYLKNLVHKIASRNPSIVVVEKSVACLAQQYMLARDMTLICNLKSSVVKRIARFTGADITPSVEGQIIKPQLGTCSSFRSETVVLKNGSEKFLLFFEGCQSSLGCTLVVSGPDIITLRRVKRVMKFVISAVYSGKLEASLLQLSKVCVFDSNSQSSDSLSACVVCQQNYRSIQSRTCDKTSESDEGEDDSFISTFNKTVFTGSPFLIFGLPYLESEVGKQCPHLVFFKKPLYPFRPIKSVMSTGEMQTSEVSCLETEKLKLKIEPTPDTIHNFVTQKLCQSAKSDEHWSQLTAFRSHSAMLFRKRFENALKQQNLPFFSRSSHKLSGPTSPKDHRKVRSPSGPLDVLSPYHHPRLAVLFCSYSSKSENAPGFCIDPWVVWMEFYGRHDLPLGDFLQRYCFNPSYFCPRREGKHCEVSMLEHTRKIVHRNASVEITSQPILENSNTLPMQTGSEIVMWDWCGECQASTQPAVVPQKDMWHLSFAKYLDYLFNAQPLPSHLNDDTLCMHCLSHQRHHYFAVANYVACFKVSPIKLCEVRFSPMMCRISPTSVPVISLVEESKFLSEKAGSVFSNMLEQTCNLKSHSEAVRYELVCRELICIHEQAQDAFRDRLTGIQESLTAMIPISSKQLLSNDPVYLKITNGLTRCKQLLVMALDQWNAAVLDIQSSKKSISVSLTPSVTPQSSLVESSKESNAGDDGFSLGVEPIVNGTASVLSVSALVTDQSNSSAALVAPGSMSSISTHRKTPSISVLDSHQQNTEPAVTESAFKKASSFIAKPLPAPVFTLPAPFDSFEHYGLPIGRVPVVVRDNELGSIVAYGLSSNDYGLKLKQIQKSLEEDRVPPNLRRSETDCNLRASADLNKEFVHPNRKNTGLLQLAQEDPGTSLRPNPSMVSMAESAVTATSTSNQHIELQFSDGTCKYYLKVFYAEQFRMLRQLLFVDGEDAFVRSLARCDPWTPKGGKSGATFYRTLDQRFILKTLSRFEMSSFMKFGPRYFDYICTALTEKKLTALAKIYGVYRVCFKNDQTKEAAKNDVLVMEYLFYGHNITQVYDLKGSLRNRLVSEKRPEQESVELDLNLLQKAWRSAQYLYPHSKTVLSMAMQNDSHFLSAQLVMDYSLLVGLDSDNNQLLVGIIDYIRTYTLDKKLEYWVKSVAVPGQLPTVISPEIYCTRFSEAIDIYFPVAPDQWTGLGHGMIH